MALQSWHEASIMKARPKLESIRNAKCFVSALLSARLEAPEQILAEMESAIRQLGGLAVGRLLQRRGASRSKRPGGASRMDQPLSARTLFSAGKVEELVAQITACGANVLLVHNALTEGQRTVLAELTGCTVLSFLDDLESK